MAILHMGLSRKQGTCLLPNSSRRANSAWCNKTSPDPGPGEVQVRVDAVGICGSDLHSYAEGARGRHALPISHGAGARAGRHGGARRAPASPAGRRATAPRWSRPSTATTANSAAPAITTFAPTSASSARRAIRDFFASCVNLPAANLLAHSGGAMSLESATLVEPLAVALHSMKFAAIAAGETVAVFGAGPIGLLTVACLKAGRRRPHLGRGAGGAPPRTGASHGRRRGARPRRNRRRPADPARHRRPRRGLRHRLRRQGATPPTRPSAPRATPAAWSSPASIRRDWCRSKSRPCAARNWRSSPCAAPITNRTPRSKCWPAQPRGSPAGDAHPPAGAIAEAFRIAEGYTDGVGKMVIRP